MDSRLKSKLHVAIDNMINDHNDQLSADAIREVMGVVEDLESRILDATIILQMQSLSLNNAISNNATVMETLKRETR